MVGMINLKSRCLYTHSKDSLRIKALMTIPDTYGVDRPWHIWNGAPMRNLVSSQFSCPSRPDIHWDWKKVAATRMDLVVPYPWRSGSDHMFFFTQTKPCGWISTPWPVRLVRNSLMDMNRIFATWDGRPDPVAPEKNASKGIRTIKDRFPVPFFQVRRVLSFGGWTIGSITAGFEGSFSWRILSKTCRSRWVSVNEHFMGRWQVDMMSLSTQNIMGQGWLTPTHQELFRRHEIGILLKQCLKATCDLKNWGLWRDHMWGGLQF